MRRKDIDWLRLVGLFLLFPFHAAHVFDTKGTAYFRNAPVSPASELFLNISYAS